MRQVIAPAKPSARFQRVFLWYAKRLLRNRFAALRIARGSAATLDTCHRNAGPVIVAMNHPAWWDPIVALAIGDLFFPGRPMCGPIEMEQWRKFGFMRRLGIFGIEPDDPRAIDAMTEHVLGLFERDPLTALGITPQGHFTDARDEIRLRPGAAVIASNAERAAVVCICVEYAFWNEQRPEVFIRAEACDSGPGASTTAWHRALTQTMRSNAEALADLVIERDPRAFEPMLGRQRARINPVYDAWLRVRRKDPEIHARGSTR